MVWTHPLEIEGIIYMDPWYGHSHPNRKDHEYGPTVWSHPSIYRKHVYDH